MTKIEMIERKQEQEANKHMIVDQHFLAKKAEARFAHDAKSAKIIAWVSLGISIVGMFRRVLYVISL